MTPILEVRGLRVRYGAIEAVKGISMTVGQAEIVTLIGGNGAGKTTTLKTISSVLRPAAGEIVFEGERTDRLPSHEVVRRGICQAPEGRRIFPRMTVRDNLEMGAYARRDPDGIGADFERVFALFPVLRQRLRQQGGTLSGGEQQMLAIGRALMSAPELLLIDELSLGLSPIVVDALLERLGALHRDGLSLVLIEQFVHRALAVADRVYLLAKGRVQFSGTPQEVADAGALEIAYLSGGL